MNAQASFNKSIHLLVGYECLSYKSKSIHHLVEHECSSYKSKNIHLVHSMNAQVTKVKVYLSLGNAQASGISSFGKA